MTLLAWAISGAAAGASGPPVASRLSAPPTASAVAIPVGADPIEVDGEIAEEIWTKAPPITEFLQRDPTEGARPTRETEARVLFDAAALYVAVRAGYAESDNRKKFSFYFNFSWFNDRHGSSGWSIDPGINYRPASALLNSVGPGLNTNDSDTQWVENVAVGPHTHYVFARINQKTVGMSTRVNDTMTPTLSLQIYARPFVSAGRYSNFKELTNGRAERYEDRYGPFAYADNPDFNYRSFRTTNVLRWEYRPGSALFIVWQQGREEVASLGDFRFGRELSGAFGAPAVNVFLIKVSRWLNF